MSSTYMAQMLLKQSIEFAEELMQETIIFRTIAREHSYVES